MSKCKKTTAIGVVRAWCENEFGWVVNISTTKDNNHTSAIVGGRVAGCEPKHLQLGKTVVLRRFRLTPAQRICRCGCKQVLSPFTDWVVDQTSSGVTLKYDSIYPPP
jgi:hypothetical protein